MKKLIYITLFLTCCVFTSCEKDKKSTIEGQFFKDCSQTPIEPVTLKIYGIENKFLQYSEEKFLGETTTDKNGFLRFESESGKNYNGLKFYRGNDLFFGTSYEDKKKFVAYDRVKVSHNVTLLVNRPFTNQDTLHFAASGNGLIFTLVGPFTNNHTLPISVTPNIGSSSARKIEDFRTGVGSFRWGLGAEEYHNVSFYPSYQVPPNYISGISQNVCGQGGDVIVDLRNK